MKSASKHLALVLALTIGSFLLPILIAQNSADISNHFSNLAAAVQSLGKFEAKFIRAWIRNDGITSTYDEVKTVDIPVVQHVLANDLAINQKHFLGYFDIQTKTSLLAFQKKYGLIETGLIDVPTREKMNALYAEDFCPRIGNSDGALDLFRVVKKGSALPPTYTPNSLVVVDGEVLAKGKICVSKKILPTLEQMFKDAAKEGHSLIVISGFRRYDIQESLRDDIIALEGEKGRKEIADPGESEHQLGLAVDILETKYGTLDKGFAKTKASKWLTENAWRYGFTLSFPEGDEKITGISFEPWHYRYVGIGMAAILKEQGISFNRFAERGFLQAQAR